MLDRDDKKIELSPQYYKNLITAAMTVRKKAYAPYSKFKVGAAILADNGEIYNGCNVENAAYGSGICAERGAAMKAIAEGEQNFIAIAICGWQDGKEKDYAYPCGACRQFLNEFTDGSMRVIVAKSPDEYKEYSLNELLPKSFGPENL